MKVWVFGSNRAIFPAEAIQEEIAREVNQLLRIVFQDRRKTGRLDLEATEMAMRSALHRAGAAALSELLRFPAPTQEHTVACPCGQQAHYRELRAKHVLTAVGQVQVSRPYYLCPRCHAGQFPADVELDTAASGWLGTPLVVAPPNPESCSIYLDSISDNRDANPQVRKAGFTEARCGGEVINLR